MALEGAEEEIAPMKQVAQSLAGRGGYSVISCTNGRSLIVAHGFATERCKENEAITRSGGSVSKSL